MINILSGALISIAKYNTFSIKEYVWNYSNYLVYQGNIQRYPQVERIYIDERLRQLSQATNKKLEL